MQTRYKDCKKCIHNTVCSLKSEYTALVGLVENIGREEKTLFDDRDFTTNIECKHFTECATAYTGVSFRG